MNLQSNIVFDVDVGVIGHMRCCLVHAISSVYSFEIPCVLCTCKGALAWYGELTWKSALAWILKIYCYLIVWGIALIFMVRYLK